MYAALFCVCVHTCDFMFFISLILNDVDDASTGFFAHLEGKDARFNWKLPCLRRHCNAPLFCVVCVINGTAVTSYS